MTPQELLLKADRALASARLLLDGGDVDGACNRAYYAMFDAARAALIASSAPAERMALVERILDSLDVPDPTLDALWAREADDRLAAYRRGQIRALPLSEVLAKYQVSKHA